MEKITITSAKTLKDFEYENDGLRMTGSCTQNAETGAILNMSINVADEVGQPSPTIRSEMRGDRLLYNFNSLPCDQVSKVVVAVAEVEQYFTNTKGGES